MLRQSVANVLLLTQPGLALWIDPDNSEAAASQAEVMLRENPESRPQAEALARRSLRRSPVAADGARMIGFARAAAGDVAATRRLMAYSQSISRRDVPAQLWMIQDAVNHDDVAGALHHYDIALRSTDLTKSMLFPVLLEALAQPRVAQGLAVTIATRPAWGPAFLGQAAGQAKDLDGLATLITGLSDRGYPVSEPVRAQVAARMVDAGHYNAAFRVYAAGDTHVGREAIRDPDFVRIGVAEGPFEWAAIPDNGLTIEPQRVGAHSALGYHAATGAGGTIARQLLILPDGRFQLSGTIADRSEGSAPAALRLTCAGSGQPIATIMAASPAFAQAFAIPASCPAQWLEVVVDGGDNPLGASGAIGSLRIAPERKGR